VIKVVAMGGIIGFRFHCGGVLGHPILDVLLVDLSAYPGQGDWGQ
jgi:hypothetical protein